MEEKATEGRLLGEESYYFLGSGIMDVYQERCDFFCIGNRIFHGGEPENHITMWILAQFWSGVLPALFLKEE